MVLREDIIERVRQYYAEIEQLQKYKDICVTGFITTFRKVPQIKVKEPGQVKEEQ